MQPPTSHRRSDLCAFARAAMRERGLASDFEPAALAQLAGIHAAAASRDPGIQDMTTAPWVSIDNDDSLDLDQLTFVAPLPDGRARLHVAVADVDALVAQGTALDLHAHHNTTSVYTGAVVFPMLPERLSNDLTSLRAGVDRLAVVVAATVDADGALHDSGLWRARVRNQAKLAYDSVAAWLDDRAPAPAAVAAATGVAAQLRAQDRVAALLRAQRHQHGVLDLESLEARPMFNGELITELRLERPSRAKHLIEDFMIAANGVVARFLRQAGVPSLRRVVRSPERWARIVTVAAERGCTLPAAADARALQDFLIGQRRADPERFPDLSLVIVKLLGPGEYVVEVPGETAIGHFGLAVRDYTHSTAPNRRYPDLVTQRLLKAVLAGRASPYSAPELALLASHCTEREDAANRVERQMRKSAGALLLERRIGERFDAVVTGASAKGVWVRLFHPPIEGKLVHGFGEPEVGQTVHVELRATDVARGFVDFVRVA